MKNCWARLLLLAGDLSVGRCAKSDPHTAPPLQWPQATEERARLALLLSAFGILSPCHTEAWTKKEEQWLLWTRLVRDGPTILLSKLTKQFEDLIQSTGDTNPAVREVAMRVWLVWHSRFRLPNISLNVSLQEIMGLGAEARWKSPVAILEIIFESFVPDNIMVGFR